MLVLNDINKIKGIESSVATIGNFDGLHYAHQTIIKDVVEKARQLSVQSILITFEPHPIQYLKKANIKLLQTLSQKLELIKSLGVSITIILGFNQELANMSAEDFVKNILIEKLRVKHLFIGYNFQFGKGKEGDINVIKKLSNKYNFNVHVQEPVIIGGIICNSTTVRSFIESGDVETAKSLLDRYYTIEGKVVKGERIGQVIGYPTINIMTSNELLPLDGVYLTYLQYNDVLYPSLTNIGFKPTFGGRGKTIESYIIDFNKSLYDERVQLCFVKRIRDEKKFDSPKKLVEQIIKDVNYARHYFDL